MCPFMGNSADSMLLSTRSPNAIPCNASQQRCPDRAKHKKFYIDSIRPERKWANGTSSSSAVVPRSTIKLMIGSEKKAADIGQSSSTVDLDDDTMCMTEIIRGPGSMGRNMVPSMKRRHKRIFKRRTGVRLEGKEMMGRFAGCGVGTTSTSRERGWRRQYIADADADLRQSFVGNSKEACREHTQGEK